MNTTGIMATAITLLLLPGLLEAQVMLTDSQGPFGRELTLSNPHLQVTVYPQWGGRIGRLIDQRTGDNLVYWDTPPNDPKWHGGLGGMLDDRDQPQTPYEVTIVRQTPQQASIQLRAPRRNNGLQISKTLTLHADLPRVDVDYHWENHGQEPILHYGLATRNFIYPGGEPHSFNWDTQRVFLPTIKAVRELRDQPNVFPELSGKFQIQVIPTWHGFIDQQKQRGIAIAHRDGFYRWFYRWIKGALGTYEWCFGDLPAGQQVWTSLSIAVTHGLQRYSDVSSDYAVDFTLDGSRARAQFTATAPQLQKIIIRSRLRDLSGGAAITLPHLVIGDAPVGEVRQAEATWANLPPQGVIEQTIYNGDRQLGSYELPLPLHDPPTSYQRAMVPRSMPRIEPIAGWTKIDNTVQVQVRDADRQRGFAVYFDEFAPSPAARGQAVEKVELLLGGGEFESFAVCLRGLQDEQTVSLRTSGPDLQGRVQREVELEDAKAAGKLGTRGLRLDPAHQLKLAPQHDAIVWFTLDGRQLSPGHHSKWVEVVGDRGVRRIAVEVEVRPIRLPRRNVFQLEVEGYLLLTILSKANNDQTVLNKWIQDLAEHRVDVSNAFNSVIHRGYPVITPRKRSTGEALSPAALNDPDLLEPLDLSEFDSWFQPMIEGGMVRVYSRESGTEEHTPKQRWLMGELSRYMGERGYGFRDRFVKFVDEMPPEFFPVMDRIGQGYHDSGWRVLHTTFPALSEAQMAILNPSTDLWHGAIVEPQVVAQRRAEGNIDPTDEIWTYDGWGAVWMPYGRRRAGFFFPAQQNLDGMHLHVYYRSNLMEALIFPTPDGPLSSAAWEGARDGIEDVQYYRLAQQALQQLRQHAPQSELTRRFDEELAEIDAIITAENHGMSYATVVSIKRRVLELLEAVAGEQSSWPRTVEYGFTRLVDAGHPRFAIDGDAELAGQLRSHIAVRAGLSLATPAQPALRITAATRDDAAIVALAAEGRIAMSPTYPRPGSYAIWSITNEKNEVTRLLLVGGDRAGADLAIRNFIRFLRVTPEVF